MSSLLSWHPNGSESKIARVRALHVNLKCSGHPVCIDFCMQGHNGRDDDQPAVSPVNL